MPLAAGITTDRTTTDRRAAGKTSAARSAPHHPGITPIPSPPAREILNRKPACACGGGCPRCQPRVLQARRIIGDTDDPLEHAADRAARAVINGDAPPAPSFVAARGREMAFPEVETALASSGQPLDAATRAFMESRFGADFGGVRIHTGSDAAASAREIAAQAYTSDEHIVFAPGQYAPHTTAGRQLLAHELAHVQQQSAGHSDTIQRAPGAPAKVPTLSAVQTTRFFTDLNTALTAVLGVKAAVTRSDYDIKTGARYASYAARSSALSGDYLSAKQQADRICAATTPQAVASQCGADKQCAQTIRQMQSSVRWCTGSSASNELIAQFMTTRGITPAGGGRSVVVAEATSNKMLLSLVHEGVHRLRGAVWSSRSKIGAGFTHSRTKQRLAHIGSVLDEGTVQIVTDLVIAELQKIPGRKWFTGYTSSSYASEVKAVKSMLTRHRKNTAFLKRAYVAASSATDVEDLQSWQP